MGSHKHKYQAYAAATQTVAKTQQIVLLYDGVIRLVQQARDAIAGKRIEERWQLLTRASEIINGLQGCLDFEKGGDIARILFQFYTTIDLNIFSIQRTNSLESCDEVIADLKKMRDVWYEIDQNAGTPADASSDTPKALPADENPDPNITLSA